MAIARGGKMIIMNLAEQEFCSVSKSFPWLGKRLGQLPGPIALEYKRLKEFTEEGRIEASLWKLVNLANITLSYLFAAALERDAEQRVMGNYANYSPLNLGVKMKYIKQLDPMGLTPLLDAIREITYWRNNYGIGHGTLLKCQTYYITEPIIKYYRMLLKAFGDLPHILERSHLSLWLLDGAQHDNHTMITGPSYRDLLRNKPWNSRFICSKIPFCQPGCSSAVRFFGYDFDLPDIYFMETFLTEDNP